MHSVKDYIVAGRILKMIFDLENSQMRHLGNSEVRFYTSRKPLGPRTSRNFVLVPLAHLDLHLITCTLSECHSRYQERSMFAYSVKYLFFASSGELGKALDDLEKRPIWPRENTCRHRENLMSAPRGKSVVFGNSNSRKSDLEKKRLAPRDFLDLEKKCLASREFLEFPKFLEFPEVPSGGWLCFEYIQFLKFFRSMALYAFFIVLHANYAVRILYSTSRKLRW